MANSKATMTPYFPKDFSTQLVEAKAAAGADHTPGDIVVVDNATNQTILCDGSLDLHNALPKLMVWTDSSSRQDVDIIRLDGTLEQSETCVGGQFKADVAVSLFTVAPSPGDFIIASVTVPGRLDPIAAPVNPLDVIGRVQGDARKESLRGTGNFVDCSFDLG